MSRQTIDRPITRIARQEFQASATRERLASHCQAEMDRVAMLSNGEVWKQFVDRSEWIACSMASPSDWATWEVLREEMGRRLGVGW